MTKQSETVENIENIGLRLQQIISENMRIALGLRARSQSDLARAFGVSRATISQKINLRINWTVEDMERAGRYLNIEPAWFLMPHSDVVVGPVGLEPTTGGLLPSAHRILPSLSAVAFSPRDMRGLLCLAT